MKLYGVRLSSALLLVCMSCSSDDAATPNPATGTGGTGVQTGGSGVATGGTGAATGGTGAATGGGGGVGAGVGAGTMAGGAGGTTAAGTGGTGSGGTMGGGTGGTGSPPSSSGASVLQYHKNATRDGVYVDAAFTRAAAAGLKRAWSKPITGPTYAQPLFFENGVDGKDMVIAATETNEVTAFDAADGTQLWRKTLGSAASSTGCSLSNIRPLGITGTPVIDAATKRIFLNAVTGSGSSMKHMIYALSLDDGSTVDGWPVDVEAVANSGGTSFDAPMHNQRGALIILDGKVYVPYGGHFGDCAPYHGWVVGVPIDDPGSPIAWATRANAGGIWAPGGIASDGTSLFVATGNTMSENGSGPFMFDAPLMWGDGESIIRLPSNLQFSLMSPDYASAMNWSALDNADIDIGGSGPVLFSVDGMNLVLGLGKDNKAYLANADDLGGMGGWLATKQVSSQQIIQAAVAYNTPSGQFFAFRAMGSGCPGGAGMITAVKVTGGSPPSMAVTWCAGSGGESSPIVTTTDGTAESIVWYVAGDKKLHGFNGETGESVSDGAEAVSTINKFQTPIAAKGKIFVAAGNELVAYGL